MRVVIREKAVDAAVFAEVRAGRGIPAGIAVAARNHAGHDLVAELDRDAGGVLRDIFAELDDLAGTFMAEDDRAEVERVALVLMPVGTADAAPFDLDQHFIIADRRNRELPHFEFARSDQNGSFGSFFHLLHLFFRYFTRYKAQRAICIR